MFYYYILKSDKVYKSYGWLIHTHARDRSHVSGKVQTSKYAAPVDYLPRKTSLYMHYGCVIALLNYRFFCIIWISQSLQSQVSSCVGRLARDYIEIEFPKESLSFKQFVVN